MTLFSSISSQPIRESSSGLCVSQLVVYRNYQPLFTNVSFALENEQTLIISGTNGQGKSTLLRCLAGFIQSYVGEIRWQGQSIKTDLPSYQQCIHYLGHKNGLFSSLSVWETLSFWQKSFKAQSLIAEEALAYWQLDKIRNMRVGLLSVGQKRRLALARMFFSKRQLLLLDEPIAALDKEGKKLFYNWLNSKKNADCIKILASHEERNHFEWTCQKLTL